MITPTTMMTIMIAIMPGRRYMSAAFPDVPPGGIVDEDKSLTVKALCVSCLVLQPSFLLC